ncbi:hypothetical protein [Pseudomonas yamanorum]
MAAHSKNFPWMSHYNEYRFFEDRMSSHNKVLELIKLQSGLYEIVLENGTTLKTFICECYSYGIAEYIESVENLGSLDIIVINSNWCGYTMEAKRYCHEREVGFYDIKGLMAALNFRKYWDHLTQYERENLNT